MYVRPFLDFYNKIKDYTDYNDVLSAYNELIDTTVLDDNNKQLIESLLDKPFYSNKIIPIPLFKTYNIYQTKDKAQILALRRIINQKNISIKKDQSIYQLTSKKCPHCYKLVESQIDTEYIICGYSEKGYNWEGCGNDWCFKCGKKLCKNWFTNELFNISNRYHDSKCCYKHSIKQNNNYDDYCKCTNLQVLR